MMAERSKAESDRDSEERTTQATKIERRKAARTTGAFGARVSRAPSCPGPAPAGCPPAGAASADEPSSAIEGAHAEPTRNNEARRARSADELVVQIGGMREYLSR